MKYTIIPNEQLEKINGGVLPWLIPVGVYLGRQAFEHSDQITKGFKKGWNGGK
ncbi:MAG: bacteriocin [Lactobacillales bacterium]|jgi:hypothetical protein|nr:bacteriocin [Lactobacillales bacterium]